MGRQTAARRGAYSHATDHSPEGRTRSRATSLATARHPGSPLPNEKAHRLESTPLPARGKNGRSDRRAAGLTDGAICVQRLDDSLNSAIHTRYRSSRRSSSMHEPRGPPLKVMPFLAHTGTSVHITPTRLGSAAAEREKTRKMCPRTRVEPVRRPARTPRSLVPTHSAAPTAPAAADTEGASRPRTKGRQPRSAGSTRGGAREGPRGAGGSRLSWTPRPPRARQGAQANSPVRLHARQHLRQGGERRKGQPVMILPQVHLRKPCYDFYFL